MHVPITNSKICLKCVKMNTHQPTEVGSKDSQNMDIFHIWDILELFCLYKKIMNSFGPCQDLLTIFYCQFSDIWWSGRWKEGNLSFQPFFEPINLLSTYHHCNVYHWLLIVTIFTNFSSTYLCLPGEQLASPLLGLVEEPRVLFLLQQLLLRSTSHIWNNAL